MLLGLFYGILELLTFHIDKFSRQHQLSLVNKSVECLRLPKRRRPYSLSLLERF